MLRVVDRIIKNQIINLILLTWVEAWGSRYNKKVKNLNYKKYAFAIKKILKKHNAKIIFEPGRSIIGSSYTNFKNNLYQVSI